MSCRKLFNQVQILFNISCIRSDFVFLLLVEVTTFGRVICKITIVHVEYTPKYIRTRIDIRNVHLVRHCVVHDVRFHNRHVADDGEGWVPAFCLYYQAGSWGKWRRSAWWEDDVSREIDTWKSKSIIKNEFNCFAISFDFFVNTS